MSELETIRQYAALNSYSVADFLNYIYSEFKKIDKKYSLKYICRISGIASTGYLHFVIQGKRKLAKSYVDGIAKAFYLSEDQINLLNLFVDFEKTTDLKQKNIINGEISLLKKRMQTKIVDFDFKELNIILALKLYSSFGLFEMNPYLSQILSVLSEYEVEEIVSHLDFFIKVGIVKHQGEQYEFTHNLVSTNQLSSKINVKELIRESLNETFKSIDQRFEDTTESFFSTEILSVKRDVYIKSLQEFKNKMIDFSTQIETSEADMLISLNYQIYPVFKK